MIEDWEKEVRRATLAAEVWQLAERLGFPCETLERSNSGPDRCVIDGEHDWDVLTNYGSRRALIEAFANIRERMAK